MDWGNFSWPTFVNTALPVYLTALATIGLAVVAWAQATSARQEASKRSARAFLDKEFNLTNHQILPNFVRKYHDLKVLLPISIQGATPLEEALDADVNEEREFDREVLINFISRRELLADGIRAGQLDGVEIHRMMGSKLIWEWSVLEGYIREMRVKTKIPDYFSEYESLVHTMIKLGQKK